MINDMLIFGCKNSVKEMKKIHSTVNKYPRTISLAHYKGRNEPTKAIPLVHYQGNGCYTKRHAQIYFSDSGGGKPNVLQGESDFAPCVSFNQCGIGDGCTIYDFTRDGEQIIDSPSLNSLQLTLSLKFKFSPSSVQIPLFIQL